jgi:hypothetical protein
MTVWFTWTAMHYIRLNCFQPRFTHLMRFGPIAANCMAMAPHLLFEPRRRLRNAFFIRPARSAEPKRALSSEGLSLFDDLQLLRAFLVNRLLESIPEATAYLRDPFGWSPSMLF